MRWRTWSAVSDRPRSLADQLRDGGRAAGAVDAAGHPVQQRGHLDDLAVGPPHQRRRLAVAGVLVLAEQLDPVGQPGRLDRSRAHACRGRDRVPCARCSRALRPRSWVCSSLACSPRGAGSGWERPARRDRRRKREGRPRGRGRPSLPPHSEGTAGPRVPAGQGVTKTMALLPAPFCATPLPKTLMPLRIWLPLSSPTLVDAVPRAGVAAQSFPAREQFGAARARGPASSRPEEWT